MHFILIDLIGNFKLLPQGHQCPLTVIDMLTNNIWYIPLCAKEDDAVVHAYSGNTYSKLGGSHKILPGNGTEFKNKLFLP